MGAAKPTSSGFWITGHTVNHIFCSSKPHISIRVIALHSFVLLACKVVSVFSRMPSLSSDGGDQWPTTGSVFFYGIMLSGSFTSLPATQQGDASCNGVKPLLTADFFGYLQASFLACMHSLWWWAHKTLEAVYSISQLLTGFFAMDCLDVWCNNGEEAETPGFLQVKVLLPEAGSP